MNINHQDGQTRGSFYIGTDKEKQAEMTYIWAGTDRIIIDHTQVGESLRGTGAGKQLVMAAVAFARNKKIKIVPLCPFAKSVFNKDHEIQDVL